MNRVIGYLPPMQLDVHALQAALRAAFDTQDVRKDPEDVAAAMMSCMCSLPATDPLTVATAIQQAWASMNAWRAEDPRVGARVIVRSAGEAAACRTIGIDALTSFAHAGRPETDGLGLLLVVEIQDFSQKEAKAVLSMPHHVRLVLLSNPNRLDKAA